MRHALWLSALAVSITPIVRAEESSPVLIYVTLPAEAKLEVDGVAVKQTGPRRRLITPPLQPGEKGQYVFRATFSRDGAIVVYEHIVTVVGGKVSEVDLTRAPVGAAVPVIPPTPRVVENKPTPKKVDVEPKPKTEPKKVVSVDPPKKVDPKPEVKPEPKLDVPYLPTPEKVVQAMLKLADVKEGDVVYDLGCGDGRIVITAVKEFGAKRGLGLELSPERVKLSKDNAVKAGVANKVEIREGDVLKLKDASEATVVTLYLLPDINEKLKPMLQKTLKPGSRIVSHDFDMGADWKPEKEITVQDERGLDHVLYLWTVQEPKKSAPPKKPAPEVKKEPEPKIPPAKKLEKDEPTIKVPYVPTPQIVVNEMLKVAGVKEGDVVYDLGCGDGRIVVTAVKDFKAKRGVGVDIDPDRIADSKKTAKDAGVENKVEFKQGDVLKIDSVADATVVTLYLFPEVNERLQPMLQKTLKPGSRIVSHDFLLRMDWPPEKEVTIKDAEGNEHSIYLWTIKEPKKK